MRAYILSIGSELILGHLTDTNATFLAQELATLGIELLHVTQVGDDRTRLADTLARATSEAELVICTGGVGPTDDDLTREAISDVVGETPAVDPELLVNLKAFFAGRGLTMPDRNAKQAWVIPSSETLPNPVGTAPGWFVTHRDRIIIAMPGVPREMTRMWSEQAVPRIRARLPERSIRTITFRTIGIGESAAEQMLDDLVKIPNPTVATYAKDDGVQIRVTGIATTEAEAVRLRDATAREVERRLASYIYGIDDTSLATAILALLARKNLRLAIVDAGGGGRFAALLLSDAASEGVIAGSAARSSTDQAATALADEAKRTFGAEIGLGIRIDVKPSNRVYEGVTDVAITGPATSVESFTMKSAFEEIQRRSALNAADVLRRALLGI